MKYLAALFALFVATVIVLADTNRIGFLRELYDFPYGDKVGHFVLYGILSFLLDTAFLRSLRHLPARWILLSISMVLIFAIGLEEWSQNFFSNRTPDWVDLIFSYAGVLIGAWVARKNSLS